MLSNFCKMDGYQILPPSTKITKPFCKYAKMQILFFKEKQLKTEKSADFITDS